VEKVIATIQPEKDVDGFHPENFGRMAKNQEAFIPATPFGMLKLLEYYQIPTAGKHCVVVGRSQIVGLPMAILMARDGYPGNCTVSICNSRTPNLKEMCHQGDILVVATGRPEFVTGDMVKPGAVVLDVGLTRVPDSSKKSGFSIKGDVHFESANKVASAITPVPGGVGPMTITALLENTLLSALKRQTKV
jgi:methylenetetrahydrofolate dehydrogenase (NADP+)/methenyltetrahydrofolate cyclohydrolase